MRDGGFSLVELLVGLTLVSVLTSLCIPAFTHLAASQRSTSRVNQMIGAVQLARQAAISLNTTTTLCPSRNSVCLGRNQWHLGAMIFTDRNLNGTLDDNETLVGRLPRLRPGERIYWRSFRNRTFLRFEATGLTDWQNGHFLYCPPDGDPRYARSVILNAQGRARLAPDSDADGVAEDARGRPLQCP